MPRQYTLRSDTAIRRAFTSPEDETFAFDEVSDEASDYEEIQSGSDSEEDGDPEFKPPNKLESHVQSEEEIEQAEEKSPSGKRKRKSGTKRPSSRGGRPRIVISGRNGYKWYTTPRQRSQNRLHPPSSYLPSPIGGAKTARTPLEAWTLLLNPSILEKIRIHTNQEIHRYRESLETETVSESTYIDVELQELTAFIGLMYFSGLLKTSKTNLEDLWSEEFGSMLYRAVMPLKRFKFLSRMLRFDDKTTRTERRAADKLAPIREIWDEFVSNCTKSYNPASLCTVDEQILSFRGRCPFKVYNGSKPDKYGIKIVMLNDARTYYMFTAEPYVGRVATQNGETVPSYYVRKLSQPIHGTTRNVTCDNWFSSVVLFDQMLEDHSLTMVGTIRKNKAQIPNDFRVAGAVESAKYAFDSTKTLLSYTPKKNKVVLLLSTFHRTAKTDHDTGKPEIITFYNTTKGGVDTFEHMCHEYTTARKTQRWPMRMWMGMLDQAGINAMILYNFNSANTLLIRREFLKQLIMALVEPHLWTRLSIPRLRRNLNLSIKAILKMDVEPELPNPRPKGRARCAFCPRSVDRKVRVFRDTCRRAMCDEHKTMSCPVCFARS